RTGSPRAPATPRASRGDGASARWRRKAARGWCSWTRRSGRRSGARGGEEGADERGEPAVHHRLHVAHLHAGAVVLDDLVWREGVGADLAAERDLLLLPGQVGQLLLLPLLVDLEEARLEDAHRGVAVAQLGALVLAGDHDAGRQVGDPHRGVGGVAPLPPP